nr:hypothetical protein [Tanacetum cinerariifolium]
MSLKHCYPRLYALESSKHISILDKLINDSLISSYLRAPRGGIEEDQQRPEHVDDEIVAEDQPYAEDASPIAQSPEYMPESDFEMHPENDDDEDPEEDHVDYLADGGD